MVGSVVGWACPSKHAQKALVGKVGAEFATGGSHHRIRNGNTGLGGGAWASGRLPRAAPANLETALFGRGREANLVNFWRCFLARKTLFFACARRKYAQTIGPDRPDLLVVAVCIQNKKPSNARTLNGQKAHYF